MPAEAVEYFISKIWREEAGEKGSMWQGSKAVWELRQGAYSRVVSANKSSYDLLMKICIECMLSSGAVHLLLGTLRTTTFHHHYKSKVR